MHSTIKSFLSVILILLSFHAYAGKNPISWQLDQSFQSATFTGRSYTVTYTFTNQLPFRLVNALNIKKNASPASDFSYVDGCTGLRLASQQSCTVQITLNPKTSGQKSVQLVIAGYSKDEVPVPTLTTQTSGQSPVGLQGVVTQSLPATLSVGQSASYLFTYTNNGSTTATNLSLQSNQSSNPSFVSTCSSSLAAGRSCTVSGSYTASSASPTVQSVSATLSYAQGSAVVESTSTSVSAVSGVTASFVQPYYLPAAMVGGASNQKTIWVLFTNNTTGPITITASSLGITTGAGGTFTVDSDPAYNNCSGSLPVSGSCQIRGVFEAPTEVSPTAFALTGSLSFTGATGSPSVIATSTTVVASLGTSRTVTFVNDCNFDVWFSLNGGAMAGSPNCSSNASVCPTGTACNASNGLCYWQNYAPINNNYKLTASGGQNTVTIPLTSADPVVQWSGNFSASTLCDGSSSCGQASCQNNGGSTSCAVAQGFSQPATQAEITMLANGADSYDVEVINGFHLPISMVPGPYVSANNYNCGSPGSNTASNGFGACAWTSGATPPGNGYIWVASGGSPCNINSPSCSTGGQLCGLDAGFNQVCGNFLGFWTANQVCASSNVPTGIRSYFNCDTALPANFPAGSTVKQIMACSVPKGDIAPTFNSCYLNYTSSSAADIAQCCGCVDWWDAAQTGGTTIGSNSTAQSCTKPGASSAQTDPQWTQYVMSGIKWIKKACPSAYTYPFDDATSGFSCTNNLSGASNSVGYTITFCPGGDTGLPSGATEGR